MSRRKMELALDVRAEVGVEQCVCCGVAKPSEVQQILPDPTVASGWRIEVNRAPTGWVTLTLPAPKGYEKERLFACLDCFEEKLVPTFITGSAP